MRPGSYRVTAAALMACLPVALAWAQDAVPVTVVLPRPAQVTDELRLTGTLTANAVTGCRRGLTDWFRASGSMQATGSGSARR